MSKKETQNLEFRNSTKQFNARLPLLSHEQINSLGIDYGLTKTQVIIIAVDRLYRDLRAESVSLTDAEKDVRMLKTVARIAPQFELGQEG